MAIYNKESKLSDAVLDNPQLIPVINRLGVSLGIGDSTIGSICAKAHIDSDFFLSVVNTFIDKDYFPVNARGTFTLEKTIDYLEKTSRFYKMVQLPNIERHFTSLMMRSGTDNNLGHLQTFFIEMRNQLSECLTYETDVFFPSLKKGIVLADMERVLSGHAEVEAKLHDLLYFFVVHLRGDYDRNLCMAVVSSVFSLERDYSQNNRIRSRILFPIMEEMMGDAIEN
ncbi:MAG: helix-turn-helix transcriptional regulator [Muribaculaceae bacterium]|nr:helix-turn-helix transcriptional regulator [Muribaculaceae bacterium]MDE6532356.1 helix-turn-helix transcriptional regulator [Muribaculaceae bacterium]